MKIQVFTTSFTSEKQYFRIILWVLFNVFIYYLCFLLFICRAQTHMYDNIFSVVWPVITFNPFRPATRRHQAKNSLSTYSLSTRCEGYRIPFWSLKNWYWAECEHVTIWQLPAVRVQKIEVNFFSFVEVQ